MLHYTPITLSYENIPLGLTIWDNCRLTMYSGVNIILELWHILCQSHQQSDSPKHYCTVWVLEPTVKYVLMGT